jgi:FixJ family two-component response regulator
MDNELIRVLFVNENEHDAEIVNKNLSMFEGARFELLWKKSAEETLECYNTQPEVDILVIRDNLPGLNGIELIRRLIDLKSDVPIIFLASSKDVNLAVEVMRLGVQDYMLKEDIGKHVFTQSILRIIEKTRLKRELVELEIKQKRLEALQEIVVDISNKISKPLEDMSDVLNSLEQTAIPEKASKYLSLIKDNVKRMQEKLEKLRNLKDDKTVKYIRDIKMIDLS